MSNAEAFGEGHGSFQSLLAKYVIAILFTSPSRSHRIISNNVNAIKQNMIQNDDRVDLRHANFSDDMAQNAIIPMVFLCLRENYRVFEWQNEGTNSFQKFNFLSR